MKTAKPTDHHEDLAGKWAILNQMRPTDEQLTAIMAELTASELMDLIETKGGES